MKTNAAHLGMLFVSSSSCQWLREAADELGKAVPGSMQGLAAFFSLFTSRVAHGACILIDTSTPKELMGSLRTVCLIPYLPLYLTQLSPQPYNNVFFHTVLARTSADTTLLPAQSQALLCCPQTGQVQAPGDDIPASNTTHQIMKGLG
jgi:hypothetical protein